MQIKINEASGKFSNIKYFQPTIYNQITKRQTLNKNYSKKDIQNKKKDIDENNSYENIINRIMEPEKKNKKEKKSIQSNYQEIIKTLKKKKSISPPIILRRKSEFHKYHFFGDNNLKLPLKNYYNIHHNSKPIITNLQELNLTLNSCITSNKSKGEKINEGNIFHKIEKENVINFVIESNQNYSRQLNNGSIFLVNNQIVNIDKKDLNNINENRILKNKSDLCIQTEPWITENISQMKFTIKDNYKKKRFLCCF